MLSIEMAIKQYLRTKSDMKRPIHNELWPTDLGMEPAKAMRRVLNGFTPDFDDDILAKMQLGEAMEYATYEALAFQGNVLRDFPLYNDKWSGKADFVIDYNDEEHHPAIVEHKGVSDLHFDYRQTWPKSTHVCQLWMYGYLYHEMFGVNPDLYLFYRSHNHMATFQVFYTPESPESPMKFSCVVDGVLSTREGEYDPNLLRMELEYWHGRNEMPISQYPGNQWTYPESTYDALRIIYGA